MAQSIVNEAVHEAAKEPAQEFAGFAVNPARALGSPVRADRAARDAGAALLSPGDAHRGRVHLV